MDKEGKDSREIRIEMKEDIRRIRKLIKIKIEIKNNCYNEIMNI